jgi:hypothetical protein
MQINYWSLCRLLIGSFGLYICHNLAIDRNGITMYNFLLFFSAQAFWGYYWGGRLIKWPESEEESD